MIGCRQKKKTGRKPGSGRKFAQKRLYNSKKQQAPSHTVQNAEYNQFAWHEKICSQRDGQGRASHAQRTPERPAGQMGADPGEQQERPADAKLPEVRARRLKPWQWHIKNIVQIITKMVQDHLNQGQTAQGAVGYGQKI